MTNLTKTWAWVTNLSVGGCAEGYVKGQVVLPSAVWMLTTTHRPVMVDMIGRWESAWGGYIVDVFHILPTKEHEGEWDARWVFADSLHP